MNLFTRLTSIGALLLAPALLAADAFEGKISLAMTSSKGDSHTLNYEMKGTAMRMEPEGSPAAIIMDLGKQQMTVLMPQQRMYMIRPILQPSEQQLHQAGSGSDHATPDIQSTGRTEKILGYTCNQFLVKDGDKTTELWMAPGMGTFMGLGSGGSPFGGRSRANSEAAAKWEQAFKGKAGFPLRVITHDASGKETFRMEATKVEQGHMPDSDFQPPDGYKQFQMPNIPGMNFGG